jgi:hypothetical protein
MCATDVAKKNAENKKGRLASMIQPTLNKLARIFLLIGVKNDVVETNESVELGPTRYSAGGVHNDRAIQRSAIYDDLKGAIAPVTGG